MDRHARTPQAPPAPSWPYGPLIPAAPSQINTITERRHGTYLCLGGPREEQRGRRRDGDAKEPHGVVGWVGWVCGVGGDGAPTESGCCLSSPLLC